MKTKKVIKRLLIVILILLIIALGLGIYYFGFYDSKPKTVKIIKEIPEYGYKLREDESGSYKKLFQHLEKVLKEKEIDEEEYVKTIAKMFIIDFYTLDNKVAKTDVGGVDFVLSDVVPNFLLNAEDTYYKYVENNVDGKRTQVLPEVDKVKVESVEKQEFTYGDNTDSDAYLIKVNWSYKNDMDDYQTNADMIFVHQDKKLVLVELK